MFRLFAATLSVFTILTAFGAQAATDGGTLKVLAGNLGWYGNRDAKGTSARFFSPSATAVDAFGNVYVSDTRNASIRKIAPDGTTTTLAGNIGGWDVTGQPANFNYPEGIAVDSSGNVFVADGSRIRKVTPDGTRSTFAGTYQSYGSVDGVGTSARFNNAAGLAIDALGNLYVADSYAHTIRKITPSAVVTTLAGSAGHWGSADGAGAVARFSSPQAVAADANGNIIVADTGNGTIRKITPRGVVSTFAGAAGQYGTQDGLGSYARFSYPAGITVNSTGMVFVSDGYMRQITASGMVTTLPGQASDLFGGLSGGLSGEVYVANSGKDDIEVINPDLTVRTLAGKGPQLGYTDGKGHSAYFAGAPNGVIVDAVGNTFVSDSWNCVIRKITPQGTVSTYSGMHSYCYDNDLLPAYNFPHALAIDSSGNIYVADASTIRKIATNRTVTTLAGLDGSSGFVDGHGAQARFNDPEGIAVDSVGNVYVGDVGNGIRKITPSGDVTTISGYPGVQGIAVNSKNELIAGYGNLVLKIDRSGNYTIVAGQASGYYSCGSKNGPVSVAEFCRIGAITLDPLGNIFVSDVGNSTIRKVTSAGIVSTVAGHTGKSYATTGALPANVDTPSSMAVTPSGKLVFLEEGAVMLADFQDQVPLTAVDGSVDLYVQ